MTREQREWFFPEARSKPDWSYQGDYIGSGNKNDRAYLESRLPQKFPPNGYFEEAEMDMLLGRDTPLRYPPIYYIRTTARA